MEYLTIFIVKNIWGIITAIFLIGLNWGTITTKLKNKAEKEDVKKISVEINKLTDWKDKIVADNIIIAKDLVKETQEVHLAAQEIRLNLKQICEKLKIKYLE